MGAYKDLLELFEVSASSKDFFKAYSNLAGKIKKIDKLKDEEAKKKANKMLSQIGDTMNQLRKLIESAK